jgi:tellurite resistance protein TerC
MLSLLKALASRFTVKTLPQALRAVKVVFGFTLLGVGVAMSVLPGPAFIVIPLALAILATEFVWARKLLNRFNSTLKNRVYPYGWFSRFKTSLAFALRGKKNSPK